jgi:hemoglobin
MTIAKELRHRGKLSVTYPTAGLWDAVGGEAGVKALIADLYRRIEAHPLLRVVFPHFHSEEAAQFFIQWFGGRREYSDALAGGLMRRHRHRHISPQAAAAWLQLMRESLAARGLNAESILRPLATIAKAMIHSEEAEPQQLRRSCDAVQDSVQVRFEELLQDAARGRIDEVRRAIAEGPDSVRRLGSENRSLVWVAVYHNRPKILKLALAEGADCNTPACDPLRATMACDRVHLGTGVSVTPLAIAKKMRNELVAPLWSMARSTTSSRRPGSATCRH